MLFEVRRETQGPFAFPTMILGFLSIFKWSQASSHFVSLISACLSRCQRDVWPLVEMRLGIGISLGSAQGIQTSLHLVR